jgi:hypothetical protein
MTNLRKKIAVFSVLAFGWPTIVSAAGYTPYVVPTEVELVNGGILIYGAFGDVNSCSVAGRVFVPSSISEDVRSKILSLVTTAIVAGRQMRFYSDGCAAVTFHYEGTPINRVYPDGINMK